jgi:hypothetical protein
MRTPTPFLPKFAIVAAMIATLVAVTPALAQNSSPDELIIQLTPAEPCVFDKSQSEDP